ncbi:hypothetical protein Tco_1295203 [Tanacetum coccineum]
MSCVLEAAGFEKDYYKGAKKLSRVEEEGLLQVLGLALKMSISLVYKGMKHVWYEVEPQGAQEDRKDEVIQDSNSDVAVAQRELEIKQLKENTNTDCLGKEQAHLGIKVWTDTEVSARHDAEDKFGVTKKKDGSLTKVVPMSGFKHGLMIA